MLRSVQRPCDVPNRVCENVRALGEKGMKKNILFHMTSLEGMRILTSAMKPTRAGVMSGRNACAQWVRAKRQDREIEEEEEER